jgi:hypothetical protein
MKLNIVRSDELDKWCKGNFFTLNTNECFSLIKDYLWSNIIAYHTNSGIMKDHN